MFILSNRLYVRCWKEEDWIEFYKIMSEPKVHQFTGEVPWSKEQTKNVIKWCIDHRLGFEPGHFNCPVFLRDSSRMIGRVGLNSFEEEEGVPEIEWTLGAKYWNQGYGTEIGKEVLRYGFEKAGFQKIIGFAEPEHHHSRRLMERIGMTYIGEKKCRNKTYSFYEIYRTNFVQTAVNIRSDSKCLG
jgi:[ribosomal protein S5]-alanine N-acetyltransferase